MNSSLRFVGRNQRSPVPAIVLALTISLVFDSAAPALGQDTPIYEQEPYDLLTLDQENGNVELKIVPLDLPDRKVPDDVRPSDRLRIRWLSRPDDEYDVLWRHVAKLELFEQLVLAAAKKLTADGKFDEAYDHFAFLWRQYRDLPGLQGSYERFLVNNAFASYRAGKWEKALVELTEVRRLQPNRPGLDSALARVSDKLVEMYVQRKDYVAARHILQGTVEKRNDPNLQEFHDKWAQQLESLAADKVTESRSLRQAGRVHEAFAAARQALAIWPELDPAAELALDILRDHAFVTVGVTQPAVVVDPRRLDNWSARRVGRLQDRLLAELVATGSEGGQYECPVGTLEISEDRRQVAIRLRRGGTSSSQRDFTGFDVARRLLGLAEPGNPTFWSDWNRLFAGVSVRDVYDVQVDLKRPHLRVESLLQVTLSGASTDGERTDSQGLLNPYRATAQNGGVTVFAANRDYLLATESQPTEVVEKYFPEASEAIDALDGGQIDVLDRLFPADVERMRNNSALVVAAYAVPTIHMLVPNVDRPYMSRRDIRRAIVYGINRPEILDREILGGQTIDGCRVISGPLPPGVTQDDPLGYGYNGKISPRPYQPQLAFTLAQLGVRGTIARAMKTGGAVPPDPSLVLVHPSDEVPRIASQLIAQQLSLIGLPCTTRELEPGRTRPASDDWDLLYVEAMMAEPLVDARRLLGDDGVAPGGSPYLSRELELLVNVGNWKEARDRLLEVHRTAHEDVSVVPLWQLVDHFVYRKGLQGIGQQPVSLYANIERWQRAANLVRRSPRDRTGGSDR